MLRKLLKLRSKAYYFLKIKIGNGDDTFFCWDPWTPFGPLIHYFGTNGPTLLGIPLFSTVKDQTTSTGWNLSPARSEKQTLLYAYITTINLSLSSDKAVWMIDEVTQRSFCSRNVWNKIRDPKPLVPWYQLVWHKARIPKHAFTVWLFILNRNPTLDRLVRWGCDVEKTCLLCGEEEESRDHLFFQCSYSAGIWKNIVAILTPLVAPSHWESTIIWLNSASLSKDTFLALLQAWHACIYEVWSERNRRYHSGKTLPPSSVYRNVLNACTNRAQSLVLHNPDRLSLLRCWESH
ncbi:Reverse transcriptase zinc-binding domain [Arabidopsis suecica]|uniref:Reverse transcriptase zinc-binding domain n=1 Tax=Arabidopsis suecica TaxID=45249 RepID=A0A8T1XWC7_ARASU|nr:Reverse transcriptase zinc-binding domain [Arabidopsis suecica]